MADAWAAGVRAAVLAIVAALLLTLAWRAPVEGPNPRAYVSVLLFSAFPVAARALGALADALGAGHGAAGTLTWTALVLGSGYLLLGVRRDSGACTLLGSLSLVVALLAATDWAFPMDWLTAARWASLLVIAVLGLGVIALRDRHRAHAAALANAAGLTALHLGFGVAAEAIASPTLLPLTRIPYTGDFGWTSYVPLDDDQSLDGSGVASYFGVVVGGPAWGWLLALLLIGFALIGYGAVDRERGPAWLGALVLVTFAIGASIHASVLWWPALLIALGLAALVAGLRPTTPTPPSPDADAPPAQEHRFSR
jgi:hypothetical protein